MLLSPRGGAQGVRKERWKAIQKQHNKAQSIQNERAAASSLWGNRYWHALFKQNLLLTVIIPSVLQYDNMEKLTNYFPLETIDTNSPTIADLKEYFPS